MFLRIILAHENCIRHQTKLAIVFSNYFLVSYFYKTCMLYKYQKRKKITKAINKTKIEQKLKT